MSEEHPHKANSLESIVLAGGCFWGMEELLRTQKGIVEIDVGYASGDRAGAAEAVRIKYDSNVLNLEDLLEYFFKIHDPTTLNRQGNDVGTQYRSAIFYTTKEQENIARKVKDKVQLSGAWKKDLTTEVTELKNFSRAEEYHQDYLQKHTGGYTCHFVRDLDF